MSEASFASLGPTLLARKGGAKPAMRPQLAPLPEHTVAQINDEALEDLGWNDMGGDDDQPREDGANVVALTRTGTDQVHTAAASPVIKRQQRDLADRVLAAAAMDGCVDDGDEEDEDSLIVAKPRKAVAKVKSARRAAFTLRLDADRHLKLRLAATMKGVSAQALVTKALDGLLDQIEDLSALAERMKRN